MLTLITGGARSGKSRFAQSLCRDAKRVTYIATAPASDPEMSRRIEKHQQGRPATWRTVEEPIEVAAAIAQAGDSEIVLVDCITLWLSNLLYRWRDQPDEAIEQNSSEQIQTLVAVSARTNVVAVTNEVGSGIVPESAVARQFRDLQGFANQQIASSAEFVYFVVSGIPICIKPQAAGLLSQDRKS